MGLGGGGLLFGGSFLFLGDRFLLWFVALLLRLLLIMVEEGMGFLVVMLGSGVLWRRGIVYGRRRCWRQGWLITMIDISVSSIVASRVNLLKRWRRRLQVTMSLAHSLMSEYVIMGVLGSDSSTFRGRVLGRWLCCHRSDMGLIK